MNDTQPGEPGERDHPGEDHPGEDRGRFAEPAPPIGPAAVAFLTLGIAWAVFLAAGWGVGYLIDRWAGTSPIFALVGLAAGVALAVAATVVRIRKYL